MYDEHVMCCPKSVVWDWKGFNRNFWKIFERVFVGGVYLVDRNIVDAKPPTEESLSHLQVIPYFAIRSRKTGLYLTVQRSKSGGESRLYGKRTLCFGGHVNKSDKPEGIALGLETFVRGLQRELEEELNWTGIAECRYGGWIYQDSDDVGSVHLGAFNIFDVDDAKVRDENLVNPEWNSIDELKSNIDQFEGWSAILISEFFR